MLLDFRSKFENIEHFFISNKHESKKKSFEVEEIFSDFFIDFDCYYCVLTMLIQGFDKLSNYNSIYNVNCVEASITAVLFSCE